MANAGGTHGGAAQPAAAKIGLRPEPDSSVAPVKKISGYGLPCSKCHLYYPASLNSCPTCRTRERVAPVPPKFPPKSSQKPPDSVPPKSGADHDREEFLKQFKAQVREAHSEATPGAGCKFKERHRGNSATGEICSACYERLQERLDAFEGALQIDLTEAAQIVYDAVWANPSEPSKTYENAAEALLTELRTRAAVGKAQGASE